MAQRAGYYLGPGDRAEIERLHNSGAKAAVIADKVGAHVATIYRELKTDIPPTSMSTGAGYIAPR